MDAAAEYIEMGMLLAFGVFTLIIWAIIVPISLWCTKKCNKSTRAIIFSALALIISIVCFLYINRPFDPFETMNVTSAEICYILISLSFPFTVVSCISIFPMVKNKETGWKNIVALVLTILSVCICVALVGYGCYVWI